MKGPAQIFYFETIHNVKRFLTSDIQSSNQARIIRVLPEYWKYNLSITELFSSWYQKNIRVHKHITFSDIYSMHSGMFNNYQSFRHLIFLGDAFVWGGGRSANLLTTWYPLQAHLVIISYQMTTT